MKKIYKIVSYTIITLFILIIPFYYSFPDNVKALFGIILLIYACLGIFLFYSFILLDAEDYDS